MIGGPMMDQFARYVQFPRYEVRVTIGDEQGADVVILSTLSFPGPRIWIEFERFDRGRPAWELGRAIMDASGWEPPQEADVAKSQRRAT
jgi:hypothetical protein